MQAPTEQQSRAKSSQTGLDTKEAKKTELYNKKDIFERIHTFEENV